MLQKESHFILIFFLILFVLLYASIRFFKKKQEQNRRQKRQLEIGTLGELETADRLRKLKGYKKVMRNVYIPKPNGTTTEIDLLVLHRRGILVVENKNYSGTVCGKEDDVYWTQILHTGKTRSFYSPVRQNEGHIRNLRNLLNHCPTRFSHQLENKELPCLSVITFNDANSLKRLRISRKTALVTSTAKVNRKLAWRFLTMKKVLTKKEVNELYKFLSETTRSNKKIQKQHLRSFQ